MNNSLAPAASPLNLKLHKQKRSKPTTGKILMMLFLCLIALIQLFPLIWLIDYSLLKSGDFSEALF